MSIAIFTMSFVKIYGNFVMKKLLLITFLLVTAVQLYSNTSPFQSLRFMGSARATALSGSFEAVTNDPSSVFFNPAAISTIEKKNFSTTFFKHVLDINSGQLVYILPEKQKWAEDGVIGASISYNSFGSFDYTDDFGNRTVLSVQMIYRWQLLIQTSLIQIFTMEFLQKCYLLISKKQIHSHLE
jgi:hypothetical protein